LSPVHVAAALQVYTSCDQQHLPCRGFYLARGL